MYWNAGTAPYMNNQWAINGTNIGANSILKVTGFDGAKSYPMGANQCVALFDENDNVFWIKTTDSAGFASYRTYRYTEETPAAGANVDTARLVTREEFDELKSMVEQLAKGGE